MALLVIVCLLFFFAFCLLTDGLFKATLVLIAATMTLAQSIALVVTPWVVLYIAWKIS